MTKKTMKLHEQYGPIVRISPNNLHFSDPKVYHTIYDSGSKLVKDPFVYTAFGADESSFGFVNPHAARGRRDVLNPLFSRRGVISMQWLVAEKFDKLCEKLGAWSGSDESVDLYSAFRCTTVDIITTFCFAECMDCLEVERFQAPILKSMQASTQVFGTFKHFPLIGTLILNSPPWLSLLMSPAAAGFIKLRQVLHRQVDHFLAHPEDLQNIAHPIIYHRLLDPSIKGASAAPATGKSLKEEAQVLLFAGSDTVGNALTIGVFNIIERPGVYAKLVAELKEAWPVLKDAPSYQDLEKLPYLTAIIKESLRYSHGAVSSLPRIVPASGMTISGKFIPGGTVVLMAAPIVHGNEEIFPDSQNFVPERWLGPDSQALESYLVPFSKGSRQCLGINLAYCELYIGFARIFRRFELINHGTRKEDLDWKDNFIPHFTGRNLHCFVKQRDN